jgi:ribonuclease G
LPLAEWLIEEGIGETRALLVENGTVLAAKLHWPGELTAGEIHTAQLISKPAGSRRGVAALNDGSDVLVDHLPRVVTEGQTFTLRISRAPIAERGRLKRAQGRYVPNDEAAVVEPLAPLASGTRVRQFPPGLWEDVWHAASSGVIEFSGGEILCSVTPAMTVIDVDCAWPQEAYFNAVPAISTALRWFDIGGNIGIDFPTILDKSDRKACDNRLTEYLADWPHECTAMNGFGFVQLVARLEGPSLLHRFATSRTGMCARMALRVAERAEGHGAVLELRVHPALKARLKPEWCEELARRTGKQVRIVIDPGLALETPNAQLVDQ